MTINQGLDQLCLNAIRFLRWVWQIGYELVWDLVQAFLSAR